MNPQSRELEGYAKCEIRGFRQDEIQSDDEKDESVAPFLVFEFLIKGFYSVSGISSFVGRGVLNGDKPFWALRIGKTLFYLVWDTERRKDKQGYFLPSDGIITTARHVSSLLVHASKYRIIGENKLGYTQISPDLFEERRKLFSILPMINDLVEALLIAFQCHHLLRNFHSEFLQSLYQILFPNQGSQFRLPNLYNVCFLVDGLA